MRKFLGVCLAIPGKGGGNEGCLQHCGSVRASLGNFLMQWKKSELFPNYEVSEFGDVKRCEPDRFGNLVGHQMTSYPKRGYRRFALYRDKKQHHVKAARLVIEAFVGPKPFEGAEVCHNDGSKGNDHFTNLRWDTHQANMDDRERHGTLSRGEKHSIACLEAHNRLRNNAGGLG